MLIRSLRAENFMKFAKLSLENIPKSGVIGIEGANESGKTTIAEAILFGLFGRTRDGKVGAIDQLIRWGTNHMRVELEFELPEAEGGSRRFLIVRELDRFGMNYVRVFSCTEEKSGLAREEVASGHIEFDRFLHENLRVDANEFQQAFYQHQTAPGWVRSSLADFAENMTGITRMEKSRDALQEEVMQLERQYAQYQKEIGRHLSQMDRLGAAASRVPELTHQLDRANEANDAASVAIDQANKALEPCASFVREAANRERQLSRLASSADDREVAKGVCDAVRDYGADDSAKFVAEISPGSEAHFDKAASDIGELGRLFSDFEGLRGSYVNECERARAQLDPSNEDSLAALLAENESAASAFGRSASSARTGAIVCFLLAVGGGVAGGLFGFHAETRELTERPDLVAQIAAGVGGFFLLLTLWRGSVASGVSRRKKGVEQSCAELRGQVAELGQHVESYEKLEASGNTGRVRDYLELATELGASNGASKESAGSFGASSAARLATFKVDHATLLAPGKSGRGWGVSRNLSALSRAEGELSEKIQAEEKNRRQSIKDQQSRLKKARAESDRIESELRDACAQKVRRDKIAEKNRELDAAADQIRSDIDDRLSACRLLEDTVARIRVRVGPSLAALVRAVLPHFTASRYRDVKVGEGMDVLVFSPERSDFVAVEELSGGTNEALFLALRLAFAQAFIKARTARPQLIVLDEPFKMMDVSRALSALETLRSVSPDLAQYFIIQPDYTEQQREYFDELITTSVEATSVDLSIAAR